MCSRSRLWCQVKKRPVRWLRPAARWCSPRDFPRDFTRDLSHARQTDRVLTRRRKRRSNPLIVPPPLPGEVGEGAGLLRRIAIARDEKGREGGAKGGARGQM